VAGLRNNVTLEPMELSGDPAMQEAVERVRLAIERGELGAADLTARRVATLLGKTTSLLYHHWGSLDVFLYDVAQSGFVQLASQVACRPLPEMAETYVRFAVAQPVLYELMFHRRWDWAALRARRDARQSAGFRMWQALLEGLTARGSADPDTDARLLFAGLHGIASLAISGRANVGKLERTDLEIAIHTARRLVQHLAPEPR
jgi:AcrR family transcriptional regulator